MNFDEKRKEMVELQIKGRGIIDPKVLKAMLQVPRHEFVPVEFRDLAYGDHPLPIGFEQTISQPFIVALMTEALELKGDEKVLEVGTGSGYQAAILSRMAKRVVTVEIIPQLAAEARKALEKNSYLNVEVMLSDGSKGYARDAPYDAILVTAAGPKIPSELVEQLKTGGRMVLPVGGEFSQSLMRVTKQKDGVKEEKICDVAFVPLKEK